MRCERRRDRIITAYVQRVGKKTEQQQPPCISLGPEFSARVPRFIVCHDNIVAAKRDFP
jgi:hypothetical protein